MLSREGVKKKFEDANAASIRELRVYANPKKERKLLDMYAAPGRGRTL